MKISATRKKLFVVLAVSPLLLLSGCAPLDWVKKKLGCGCGTKTKLKKSNKKSRNISGQWVVKVGDEVVVASIDFEKELEQLLEDRPQLKQMLPLMPNLEQDFAKGLGNQEVIARYVQEKGLDQNSEYKEKKDRMLRAVDQMINAEFFTKTIDGVKLADADLLKFYNENKDTMQGIMISQGGIKTSGVSFDKKLDAEAFLAKVKAEKNLNLQTFAKDAGLSAQDFNLVNNQSFGVDPVLRTKIMGLKKFPIVDMIAVNDKKFWVVYAEEKKETQYRPFAEIKEGIRNAAEQTEKGKQVQAELEKLTKSYGVVVNDAYLQQRKKSKMAGGQSASEKVNFNITPEQLSQALEQAQAQEQASESKAV